MSTATETGSAFRGIVDVTRVRFARDDGGWVILEGRHDGQGLTVVGADLSHVQAGDSVNLQGRWETHSTFGPQVRASQAQPVDPTDARAQRKLLLTLPGVGAKHADRLVDLHGPNLFAVLDGDPEAAFASLPRFASGNVAAATAAWREKRSDRALYMLLAREGLSRLLGPLVRRHGQEALEHVQADPYLLVQYRGVGFETADRIAVRVGVSGRHPRRVEAAVLHTLREAEGAGHTYLTVDELLRAAAGYVEGVEEADVAAAARVRGAIVDGNRAASAAVHRAERSLARRVRVLAGGSVAPLTCPLPEYPPADHQQLSGEQWTAVARALEEGFSVIDGRPGTGKTATVHAIVELAGKSGLEVVLCAPTGRAARRLQQATGRPASTVHAVLEWGQRDGCDGPRRDAQCPIDADVLVVDECSMLDTYLANQLLTATPAGCRVIFVGDYNQLPSIGPGKVLVDVICSEAVPVTRLTTVFRQARHSMIVRAAHAINRGHMPSFERSADDQRDLFFIDAPDADEIPRLVGDLVADRLPHWSGVDPVRDIMVFAPGHGGPAGVQALNSHLARRLNPAGTPLHRLPHLLVGGKVMWTRNNDRELGVTNGTILIVIMEERAAKRIHLVDEDGRPVIVPYEKADHLEPANALTVHKAQGSETPMAVIVMHRNRLGPVVRRTLLSRPMFYTALTRARLAAVIVGERGTVAEAIRNATTLTRNTGLEELLRDA